MHAPSHDPPSHRARLIGLLGVDGAGKTTQATMTAEWLKSRGQRVILHPNESLQPLKSAFRSIAERRGQPFVDRFLSSESVQLALTVVKWNTMAKINSLISSADFIVLDRYVQCQIASANCQGLSNRGLIEDLCSVLPPLDLTIFMDIPVSEAVVRIRRRGTDEPEAPFMESHSREYMRLLETQRHVRINAARSVDVIQRDIRTAISAAFDL